MAFAIPIVKQNYAIYGAGGSSGQSSVSSSPAGSPPKIAIHPAPVNGAKRRPPLCRSASAKTAPTTLTPSASDSRMPVAAGKSKEAACGGGLTRNANSFTAFHEALVVKLTKAVRKISR